MIKKEYLIILRPVNCLMGSLTVIIGLLNTRIGIPSNILLINIILGVITSDDETLAKFIKDDILSEIEEELIKKRPGTSYIPWFTSSDEGEYNKIKQEDIDKGLVEFVTVEILDYLDPEGVYVKKG